MKKLIAELLEDQEALLSKPYLVRIAKARRDLRAGSYLSLDAIVKEYDLA